MTTKSDRDHELRKLYSERHHLTRSQRLGHLSSSGQLALERLEKRIDELEWEEDAPMREMAAALMAKIEAIQASVDELRVRLEKGGKI